MGYPGGCKIGECPIDIHLEAFGRMNIGTTLMKNIISCSTFLLQGADITLRLPSVGATENILMAACLAKGKTTIKNAAREPEIIELVKQLGSEVVVGDGSIFIKGFGKTNTLLVDTGPYPMTPTDIQSFLLVALLLADGDSIIHEGVFENRYIVVSELEKMGAHISLEGQNAVVKPSKLYSNKVVASDLRGGAALVLAGIIADGITTIDGIEYILRGYEDIVRDLSLLGLNIYYI